MTHIVILGAGIAGITAAYALQSQLDPSDAVTVVSDQPYFHFVPSNPWIAMGWRERADVAFPIGPCLESRGIRFIHSGVRHIEPGAMQVDLENGRQLVYDTLLIATGAAGMTDAIPGMAEHTCSVLHIDQAERAFTAYHDFVRHPGAIVIGAAPGASVLGPIYEYAFLVDADLKRRNIRDRVDITLVTPEPWPGHLGLGAEGDSRGAMQAALAAAGIRVVCNAVTTRIDKDRIHVNEVDAAGGIQRTLELPYAYSVYWPAFGGVPGVRSAAGLVDGRGLVVVDEYLRNPDHPDVFALGACVAQPAAARSPVPMGAPESVYSISKASEIVVHNILARIRAEPLVSHVPQRAQWLTDMGETGAAYLSEPQVPLRDINWMRQGRWVHQAKVDFEKYVVNRIRLQPAGQAPSVASKIANVISQGQAGTGSPPISASKGAGMPLEIRLSHDPGIELRALARSLGREPDALAAELLAAAVSDAKSYLDTAGLEALALSRRALLVEELPERQPGVEFHGGGT